MLRVYKFCLAASLLKPRCHICDSPGAHFQNDSGNSAAAGKAGKGATRKASLAGFDFGLAYCELGASRCWLSLLLLLFVSSNFGRTWQTIYQTKYALEIVQGNYEYPAHSPHTHTLHTHTQCRLHTQCIFIQFELTPVVINCASEMYSQVSEATWNLAQLCQRLFKGISFQLEVFRAGQTNRNQLQTE